MKIEKIIICNFMPYEGEQVIYFPQHETQNVMLLFGDNMRGKTSFLNAIRWCFYGIALGRHLREIPRVNLVNRDAASEGRWSVAVTLTFKYEESHYVLSRRIEKRDNISQPRNNADFIEIIGLRIDGQPIEGDLINNEINQVMPKEVSRFFLFDGELLQEYENLLIEKSDQGKKIKAHIESVLGVPALVHGRDEFNVLLKDARDIQRKDAQKNEDSKTLAQDQKNHQLKLDSLEENLKTLESQRDAIQGEIDVIDDYLKNTEVEQEKKIEIERLEGERKGNETRILKCHDNIKRLLKTAWKDVLARSVGHIIEEAKRQRDEQQDAWCKYERLESKIASLRESLDENKVCETCGQEISQSIRDALRDELVKLENQKKEYNVDFEKMTSLITKIDKLELIRAEGEVNRIVENYDDITRAKVKITNLNSNLREFEDEIRGFDTDEIMRQREKKTRLIRLQAQVEGDIRRASSDIDLNIKKQRQISKLMARTKGSQGVLSAKRVECLEQLETVFREGIDQLRDKLRDDVQKYATEAFKRLITEKSYSGLQINQSYGLSILDDKGNVLNERSAGAEQVVALALIDGLNKTSRKKGPIIMDTPLGRLDPKHRNNVLMYLPDMSDQVILLVH